MAKHPRGVLQRPAPGVPFDTALFDLVEDPIDAPWPRADPLRFKGAAGAGRGGPRAAPTAL